MVDFEDLEWVFRISKKLNKNVVLIIVNKVDVIMDE